MSREMIHGIIFDLDGTLLNTLEDIADSVNTVLRQCGESSHELERYRSFIGNGLKVLIQRAMPAQASEQSIERAMALFNTIYEQGWHKKTIVYPGIHEMLEKLQNDSFKMAILSNKPHQFTVKCVRHYFSESGFDAVVGKKDDYPAKPDPTSTLNILKSLDLAPHHTLFVGDSSVDILTGVKAGMKTAGVSWGFRTRSELEAAGAHFIANTPEELFRYVYSL